MHGYFTQVLRRGIVKNGRKRGAVVGGVPKPARGVGHIKFGRIFGVYLKVNHTSAHYAGAYRLKLNGLKMALS